MNTSEKQAGPAVIDTAQRVRSFVALHGRTTVTILVGGGLATLGAIAPFAHMNGLFGGGVSYSLLQGGFYGLVLLAIPVVLGVFPIALKRYARLKLVAFGLSCAMFGIFFAVWLAASGIAGTLGVGAGGFSIGFFLTLVGYAITVGGYYRLQSEAAPEVA